MDELSLLSQLHDRVKQLERELPVLRGNADVWKSKAKKTAAREQYLLGEVMQLDDQFKCQCSYLLSFPCSRS